MQEVSLYDKRMIRPMRKLLLPKTVVASPELKKLKHLYRCSAALKDELTLHLEKKERLPKEVTNACCNEYSSKNRNNKKRELLKQHKELLENFQLLLTISGIGENSYLSSDIKAFQAIGSICYHEI